MRLVRGRGNHFSNNCIPIHRGSGGLGRHWQSCIETLCKEGSPLEFLYPRASPQVPLACRVGIPSETLYFVTRHGDRPGEFVSRPPVRALPPRRICISTPGAGTAPRENLYLDPRCGGRPRENLYLDLPCGVCPRAGALRLYLVAVCRTLLKTYLGGRCGPNRVQNVSKTYQKPY